MILKISVKCDMLSNVNSYFLYCVFMRKYNVKFEDIKSSNFILIARKNMKNIKHVANKSQAKVIFIFPSLKS